MKNGVRILVVMIFGIGSVFAMRPPKRPLPEQEELAAQKPKSELKEVKFESSDGQEFILVYDPDDRIKAPANILRTVAQLISEAGTDQIIPLPSLNAAHLNIILPLVNTASNFEIQMTNELDPLKRENSNRKAQAELGKMIARIPLVQQNGQVDLIDLILDFNYLDSKYLLDFLINLVTQRILLENDPQSLMRIFERLKVLPVDMHKMLIEHVMTVENLPLSDIKTEKLKQIFTGQYPIIIWFLVDPNDKFLVCCEPGMSKELFIISLPELSTKKISFKNRIAICLLSPNGQKLVIKLFGTDTVYIYDMQHFKQKPIAIKVDDETASNFKISPSARYLSCSTLRGILIFDLMQPTHAPLVLKPRNPTLNMSDINFISERRLFGKLLPGYTLAMYTISESNFVIESSIEIQADDYVVNAMSTKGIAVVRRNSDTHLGSIDFNAVAPIEHIQLANFFRPCPLNGTFRGFSFDGLLAVIALANNDNNDLYLWDLIKNAITPLQITITETGPFYTSKVALSKNNQFLMQLGEFLTITDLIHRNVYTLQSREIFSAVISHDVSFILLQTDKGIFYCQLFPGLVKQLTFLEVLLVIKLKKIGMGLLQNLYFQKLWNDMGTKKQEMVTKYLRG